MSARPKGLTLAERQRRARERRNAREAHWREALLTIAYGQRSATEARELAREALAYLAGRKKPAH